MQAGQEAQRLAEDPQRGQRPPAKVDLRRRFRHRRPRAWRCGGVELDRGGRIPHLRREAHSLPADLNPLDAEDPREASVIPVPLAALLRRTTGRLDVRVDGPDELTLADTIPSPDDKGEGVSSQAYSNLGFYSQDDGLPIDSTRYLFVEGMADWCGVSADKLRRWDRSGELPAMRLGTPSLAHRGKESGQWRVYPKTPAMKLNVQSLVEAKRAKRNPLRRGELSRPAAAEKVGVAARTLQRWEDKGIARPKWRGGRPVYTEKEVARLQARLRRPRGKRRKKPEE